MKRWFFTVAAVAACAFAAPALADSKSWDGGAGTTSWHDGANWNPDGVPGPADDVFIGGVPRDTIEYLSGATTVNSIQCHRTLVMHGGQLGAATSFYVQGGSTLDYRGGSFSGSPILVSSKLKIGASATAAGQFRLAGQSSLQGDIRADQEAWIIGGLAGHANLTLVGAVNNAGVIRMESINGGWDCALTTSAGSLVNATGGLLGATSGTGGTRNIHGGFTNNGTINVDSDTLLTAESSGATVLLSGGIVNANGKLRVHLGTLRATGGRALGRVSCLDGIVDIAASVTQRSYFESEGGLTELVTMASTASQLKVTGGTAGHAYLNTRAGALNAGNIVLESANGGWESNIKIIGTSFLNNGSIVAALGTGGARHCFNGNLVNAGTISVAAGEVLTVSDGFTIAGGTNQGDMRVYLASISVTASPSVPVEVVLLGNGNTLLTDNLHNVTLWVQGGLAGHGMLDLSDGRANHGTLKLESINGGWESSLRTAIGTFTNASDGSVLANVGTGGVRVYAGNMVNAGSIQVEAGTEVHVEGTYPQFVQTGGVISGQGRFRVYGGLLRVTGGQTTGLVSSFNGAIDIASTVTQTSIVQSEGEATVLIKNASTATTVHALGGSIGHAYLHAAAGAVNNGTIRLESINGGWDSILALDGSTLINNGTIQVLPGSGGGRSSSGGTLANAGAIEVADPSVFYVTTAYRESGGTTSGPVLLYDATISETVGPATSAELQLIGSTNVLVTNNLPRVRLWVRGGVSGHATLLVADGVANQGTIVLDSVNGGWNSSLQVLNTLAPTGSLANSSDGLLQALPGTGGGRYVQGNLVNAGRPEPGYPSSLSVLGDFTQQPTGIYACEFAGSNPSEHSTMNVTGLSTLGGSLSAKRDGGYLPISGQQHTVLNTGSRRGTFANIQSCDGVMLSYTATTAQLAYTNASGIMGDLSGDGIVNGADLGMLLGSWGPCGVCCAADLNADGIVDGADLGTLLGNWTS